MVRVGFGSTLVRDCRAGFSRPGGLKSALLLGRGLVTLRGGHYTWMPALAGGARRRITFFACAKKVTKESTPTFAALRVPKFSNAVRAAAQLALRAQTVLADCPRTALENLAAQRGCNTPLTRAAAHPSPLEGEGLGDQPAGRRTQRSCGPERSEGWAKGPQRGRQQVSRKGPINNPIQPYRIAYATPFPSPLTEPRLRGEAGGRRRKLSERSEFFRRPDRTEILGVSTEGGVLSLRGFDRRGRAFFGYLSLHEQRK